ncbi:hypothetical protein G3545_06285 [Starkeya sp. ORNL1]|uniref:DUF7947 five-stranded beta-barrel domain-containing protein n=1 Tax=Starkeya sp. ORNL1 TaxID=2709380 RepID=UPI0014649A9E|nr:hypothetical protein [Starkeya sp. ORNL1]QJP13293.1 hypothetical protein G3545_06285 [Starkeya sp. ORNL1]
MSGEIFGTREQFSRNAQITIDCFRNFSEYPNRVKRRIWTLVIDAPGLMCRRILDGQPDEAFVTQEMTFTDRVQRRMSALELTAVEVERRAGFNRGYVSDLFYGKKGTIKGGKLVDLARVLETTEIWLLRGVGEEDRGPTVYASLISGSATSGKAEPMNGLPAEVRTSWDQVSRAQEIRVSIKWLNLETGACGVATDSHPEATIAATIVDPAIMLPNSPYGLAFASRSIITVIAKAASRSGGQNHIVIIDFLETGG